MFPLGLKETFATTEIAMWVIHISARPTKGLQPLNGTGSNMEGSRDYIKIFLLHYFKIRNAFSPNGNNLSAEMDLGNFDRSIYFTSHWKLYRNIFITTLVQRHFSEELFVRLNKCKDEMLFNEMDF